MAGAAPVAVTGGTVASPLQSAVAMWLAIILGTLGIVVLTIGYLAWVVRRHGPAITDARRALFTATGYRHPEAPTASVDDALAFVPHRVDLRTGGFATRYVARRSGGEQVVFEQDVRRQGRVRVRRQHWGHTLARPPAVRLQIAERGFLAVGKAARELLTGTARTWQPIYPHAVPLDEPALDRRLVVLTDDAAAAQRLLAADPGLVAALAALPEVDLRVTDREIRLDDPGDRLLRDAGGAVGGRAATLADPSLAIRASIPAHQQMCALLDRVRAAVA